MKRINFLLTFIILFPLISQAQHFAAPQVNFFGLSQVGSPTSCALVDLDADGDLDLVVGTISGDFLFYENKGSQATPIFTTYQISPFNLKKSGQESAPFFADLDNDGDQDLMCGNLNGLFYYENTGDSLNPYFADPIENPFSLNPPEGFNKPFLADIDSDGDLDLFTGSVNGKVYYFENTSTSSDIQFESVVAEPFGLTDVGQFASPTFGDTDGDGDKDAIIGESDNGNHIYFENTGTAQNPSFDSIGANPSGLESVDRDAKPFFADLDGDGDKDLMTTNNEGDYYYFQNTSSTGISNQASMKVKISPNPANQFIQIPMDRFSPKQLVVYNNMGQLVLQKDLLGEEIQLSTGDWNPGFYHLKIETMSGEEGYAKFIIAR